MPNHMKGCGCQAYRAGREVGVGRTIMWKAVGKFRRAAERRLRAGEEPDAKFGVGSTDHAALPGGPAP